ncbi:FAD:protein FMN transferase [Steroidobacter sp.]|uniref:FAD:protein FMN transferase n=1 Tax=Steroidobacter sp. TaxID=1978227 RepID=UPI001A5C80E8|nr:FAD:protein FMN transferase [Steroidobacter sp.]MBL8265919.1 FAD:protein FMN transferase [Steroidobacter sp.]
MVGASRAFIGLVALAAAGCARAPEELAIAGPTMGTTYSIKVASAPDTVDAHALRVAADQVLERIDLSMSGYRDDSEISRFNASTSTDWVEVSTDLATVVDYALQVSRDSGGTFDITVGPLVAAWGFGAKGEPIELPDATRLAELKAQVGYQKLQARLQPPALRKADAALRVDLNGIAPGYAVDLMTERFRSMQLSHFMIDIGGEVRAQGRNARGQLWRIAVERPIDAEPEPYAIVQLDDAAVTTSGEYRHYFDRDGHRYSHTIDPRTGRPVEHTLASVVVIGPTSMYTDAWTTALNVLGTEAGMELATKLDMPALFIEARGTELHSVTTPRFAAYVAAP